MFGRVILTLEAEEAAITIPARAIRTEGSSTFVYSVVDAIARRVNVDAAVGDGVTAVVTKGLEGDEQLVVSARGPLSDGSPVNAVPLGPEAAL